jgi:hypothetical protein
MFTLSSKSDVLENVLLSCKHCLALFETQIIEHQWEARQWNRKSKVIQMCGTLSDPHKDGSCGYLSPACLIHG